METANLIQKLRKINRGVSFNIWRVRIGGVEMALFFLFAIGEKLISKFVPMEPETAHIVSETLSCISVLILGEAILRALYKLFPRYRWATLLAMIGGAIGGLLITIVMDGVDSEVAVDKNDFSITINGEHKAFDYALIIIHGTPGEDGKLQGYLEMMEIPFSSCSTSVSCV